MFHRRTTARTTVCDNRSLGYLGWSNKQTKTCTDPPFVTRHPRNRESFWTANSTKICSRINLFCFISLKILHGLACSAFCQNIRRSLGEERGLISRTAAGNRGYYSATTTFVHFQRPWKQKLFAKTRELKLKSLSVLALLVFLFDFDQRLVFDTSEVFAQR